MITDNNSRNSVRIRPDIAALQGYHFASGTLESLTHRYGRPADQIIKLDTNENPYGPSPKAVEAVAALNPELAIYPDHQATYLRELLADYCGAPSENILVTGGSDQLIELTLRLFMDNQGDSIINCPPTFTMYPLTATWMGSKVINIPRLPDFSLDVPAIQKAALENDVKILFLCSPNNPTGELIPYETLEQLLDLPLVVVLDEAYWEFAEVPNLAPRVTDTPNLVLMRTFSKWAGLAGLRIGYGIYPLVMMEHLWKIKPPFNVTTPADVAARATLGDLPTMQTNIQKIVAERERLYQLLTTIAYLRPFPSHGNYIFAYVEGIPLETLQTILDNAAILIRYYPAINGKPAIRISVGKPEHTDRLMAVLRQIKGEPHA